MKKEKINLFELEHLDSIEIQYIKLTEIEDSKRVSITWKCNGKLDGRDMSQKMFMSMLHSFFSKWKAIS